jgi:hypothetical protein
MTTTTTMTPPFSAPFPIVPILRTLRIRHTRIIVAHLGILLCACPFGVETRSLLRTFARPPPTVSLPVSLPVVLPVVLPLAIGRVGRVGHVFE